MLKTETNEITGSYATNHWLFSPLQEGKKKENNPPLHYLLFVIRDKKKVKALLIGLIAHT